MKCPHCLVEYYREFAQSYIGEDDDGDWGIRYVRCPNTTCNKIIITLVDASWFSLNKSISSINSESFVRPKSMNRNPLSPEVPQKYKEDYKEACLVLIDSPKASAALSRRCLQKLLREKAGIKPSDLSKEIQEVIDSGKLPTVLAESIDAIRNIGNFASHPIKSESTGEIVEVEPGEAEWNLDVLESLFDFYFVQPEKLKRKKEALNKKLEDSGKPKMK